MNASHAGQDLHKFQRFSQAQPNFHTLFVLIGNQSQEPKLGTLAKFANKVDQVSHWTQRGNSQPDCALIDAGL